jgi:hypothetical protein
VNQQCDDCGEVFGIFVYFSVNAALSSGKFDENKSPFLLNSIIVQSITIKLKIFKTLSVTI